MCTTIFIMVCHIGVGEDKPMMTETAADPTDYETRALDFEEMFGPCDLKVETPDGHTWYYVECNGPCRPGFGEGYTSLFINSADRAVVSIEVQWGDGEYENHDVKFRLVDHEPPEDADEDSEDEDNEDGDSKPVMTDGGVDASEDEDSEPEQYTDEVPSLANVREGDRIGSDLISREVPTDTPLADVDGGEVTIILRAGRDKRGDTEEAILYDPDADVFARASRWTDPNNWNESAWTISSVGEDIRATVHFDMDTFREESDEDVTVDRLQEELDAWMTDRLFHPSSDRDAITVYDMVLSGGTLSVSTDSYPEPEFPAMAAAAEHFDITVEITLEGEDDG